MTDKLIKGAIYYKDPRDLTKGRYTSESELGDLLCDEDKEVLKAEFYKFIEGHSWSKETEIACTYTFFHTLNMINEYKRLIHITVK